MNANQLRRPALFTAGGVAAALLVACGQSADPSSSGLATETTSDALTDTPVAHTANSTMLAASTTST